jgi:hypothetical protein
MPDYRLKPKQESVFRRQVGRFWRAVQRMMGRGPGPTMPSDMGRAPDDPDDDGLVGSGVRRRPPGWSGAAGAAAEPETARDRP